MSADEGQLPVVPSILSAATWGAVALGLVAILLSVTGLSLALSWFTLLGVFLSLLAAIPAIPTAMLPYAARHIYNLHYVFFLGVMSTSLLFPALPMLAEYQELQPILAVGMMVAGPWALAHLLASAASSEKGVRLLAVLGAAAGVCALKPFGGAALVLTVLLLAGLVAQLMPQRWNEPRPEQMNPGWGLLSFLLLNGIALLGLMPVLALMLFSNFSMTDAPAEAQPAVFMVGILNADTSLLALSIVKYSAWLVGGVVTACMVYAWPSWRVTRGAARASAAAVLVALACGGFTTLAGAALALALVIVLMGLATAALAFEPRVQRGPSAAIAGAIGSLAGLHVAAPVYSPAVTGVFLVLLDSLLLAGAFTLAYVGGVRVLRTRYGTPPQSAAAAA